MNRSPDYDTVARAIRFLWADFKNQLSLKELAKHVHQSPFHFPRIFTRCAGVGSRAPGLVMPLCCPIGKVCTSGVPPRTWVLKGRRRTGFLIRPSQRLFMKLDELG
jgi:AraC-like DNA-binding protein